MSRQELEDIYSERGPEAWRACLTLHHMSSDNSEKLIWIRRAWSLNPTSETAEKLIKYYEERRVEKQKVREVLDWMLANRPDTAIALFHAAKLNWNTERDFKELYWKAMTTDSELSRSYVIGVFSDLKMTNPNAFIPWGLFKPHWRVFWEYPTETRIEIRMWLRIANRFGIIRDVRNLICSYIGTRPSDYKCMLCNNRVKSFNAVCEEARCMQRVLNMCKWFIREGEHDETRCGKSTIALSRYEYCEYHHKQSTTSALASYSQYHKEDNIRRRERQALEHSSDDDEDSRSSSDEDSSTSSR